MARKLRIEFEGAIYHITCRLVGSWGDGDRELYRDDGDRWRFLDVLGERVDTFGVVLHQYVLMANHFHLVLETPRANCGAFMQSLLTAYTVYFNLRHGRHGHLFDGRYKAKLVEGDAYLLGLSRYVHLNPVRVGGLRDDAQAAMKHLRSYYWSSYLQYIDRRKRLDFLTVEPTLALAGGKGKAGVARYRRFVEAGLGEEDEGLVEAMSASCLGIGGRGFLDDMQARYAGLVARSPRPEDAAFRKALDRLEPAQVLAVLADCLGCPVEAFTVHSKARPYRPFAARFLTKYAGLGQREIAALLGVSTGAAVSMQLRRFKELVASDRELRRLAGDCDMRLGGMQGATTRTSILKI